MKKFKLLSALLALLLCASVALTACGKKDDEEDSSETETEATTEKAEGEGEEKKEPVTYKLADVMNKDWTLKKKDVLTTSTAVDFVGSSIRVSFDDNLNSMFFVTREENSEDANKDVTHVYNVVTGKEILKIEESLTENKVEDKTLKESNRLNENRDGYDRGNDGMNSVKTYKNGYVNVFTETHFAVLSITAVEDEHESLSKNLSALSNFPDCPKYSFADSADDHAYAKYTLTIYDAEGKAVKTFGEKEIESRCDRNVSNLDDVYSILKKDYIPAKGGVNNAYMASDLLIDGTKVYRLDANGTSTLVKDFGLEKMPYFENDGSYGTFTKFGEKYLEHRRYSDFSYHEYINQYTVYSKDLATEIIYNVPSIANSSTVNLLANGNLLVQYTVTLNENEETYDFRSGATGKYDLKTFIVTKDGATELEDVDYLIKKTTPSVTNENGQKIYAEKIENLAFIYPIAEDKTLDESANNVKLVALSNDLKTVNEVICADKLVNFPYHIDDNTFAATLASGGTAYYNENGEKISVLKNTVSGKYKYVGGDGIYDIKGAKVYDYKKNNTLFVEVCGESFVIKYLSYDENGAKDNYALFVDGELKTIAGEVTDVLDFGVYAVDATVKKDDGTVVENTAYYNEKGAPLGTFAGGKMACMLSGDGYAIFRSETENKFYKFTATAPEAK